MKTDDTDEEGKRKGGEGKLRKPGREETRKRIRRRRRGKEDTKSTKRNTPGHEGGRKDTEGEEEEGK
jgi:hypothetical protein